MASTKGKRPSTRPSTKIHTPEWLLGTGHRLACVLVDGLLVPAIDTTSHGAASAAGSGSPATPISVTLWGEIGKTTPANHTFPASMPQVILYDSACKLLAHTYKSTAEERDRFTESIVAVDAFHLKSNREDDCFCRKWTDPNLSPQLKKDGSWIFNSSAAEIANIWYGGFASICRNMTAIQYNFFLDEMVWLHNIRMCAIKNNGIKIGSLNQLCDVDCITSSSGYL
ncbi:hypothetical protein PSTG_12472 [Puccinia striiformis f. sp. tritici PST-78]|uniref:Uncharacterized protein n=1 Tax=Puccinia striiformis f. sp. tritici PST-78 TaxID=1165861 RepID=A0A0L0V576_9BASI|nr:hypothetical protein PSTG_12472 [Puccinia striiformis f. sp. tritici PST-78]